jgi:transposase
MLARFLCEYGVELVAMESAGIYSIVVFMFLQAQDFRCMLLDPRSVKAFAGRKTDVSDCQWIQRLVSCGIPGECFVPSLEMCVLRSLLRLRCTTVRELAAIKMRIQKVLRRANFNLDHAVTDPTGVTGLAIIDAILAGEMDPLVLAEMRDVRCKKKVAEIARCLDGFFADDTMIMLRFHREQLDSKMAELEKLDEAILDYLERLEPSPVPAAEAAEAAPRRRLTGSSKGMERRRDELVRIVGGGVDLTAVPGISVVLAMVIISEIGTDMSRWPSVKHFASWLGLCPGSKISGDRVISAASRKVNSPAAHAFILAARSAGRSRTSVGDFYRRKSQTRGAPKALTATAHLIARIVYAMMRNRAPYVSESREERESKSRAQKERRAIKLAAQLGCVLMPVGRPEDRACQPS